jgi:putative endonuclease
MSEFTVYVLQSEKNGKLYKGQTENLENRLNEHNRGKTKSTRSGIPWKVIYMETFKSREESLLREKYFKSAAGRRWIKENIVFDY